jgi:hypothetical protein
MSHRVALSTTASWFVGSPEVQQSDDPLVMAFADRQAAARAALKLIEHETSDDDNEPRSAHAVSIGV